MTADASLTPDRAALLNVFGPAPPAPAPVCVCGAEMEYVADRWRCRRAKDEELERLRKQVAVMRQPQPATEPEERPWYLIVSMDEQLP